MSMATRTDTQSPALHVADSHDLIHVQGARENTPIILRSARGAHRYSPKCPEEKFGEVRHSPGPVLLVSRGTDRRVGA
jgi:hypothetical protein